MLAIPAPWWLKRRLYGLLGWQVDPSAHVGLTLIDADHVAIGSDARIGHFNFIAGIGALKLGSRAYVRHGNIVSGDDPSWPRELVLAEGAHIMNFHYVDLGGRCFLGQDCVLGGRGTQIWTHQLEPESGWKELSWGKVEIGDRAYVGARCIILPGARLPAGAALGAGSVLGSVDLPEGTKLVAGNPARHLR